MNAAPHIQLHKIPSGYRGTLKTVGYISGLIRQGAKDFRVRQKAIDILRRCAIRPKDYWGEIRALFDWVQQNIRYTRDTYQVEVLHSARRMLELRAGDCDDVSILLGALLESIGHPVRMALSGPDPRRPDLFSHIYLEVFLQGRWIPLDATMPYPMGWASSAPVKKIIAIQRSANMLSDDGELQGISADSPALDWLQGLIRSVRGEAMKPKDPRVKSLWGLLRQRQLLHQNPWLAAVLQRIWQQGLSAQPHPRTARRMVHSLRRWGILPPKPVGSTTSPPATQRPLAPAAMQAMRPVVLKPIAPVRPAAIQALRSVQLQPTALQAAPK